jgi:hypothetical protein
MSSCILARTTHRGTFSDAVLLGLGDSGDRKGGEDDGKNLHCELDLSLFVLKKMLVLQPV